MTAFEAAAERRLFATELQEAWPVLSPEERLEGLRLLPHAEAEEFPPRASRRATRRSSS